MTLDMQLDPIDQLGSVDLADEDATVRRTVTAIARLLGAPGARRPHDLASFVAASLGVATGETAVVSSFLRGIDWPLIRVEVAHRLQFAHDAVLRDDCGTGSPGYDLVRVDVDEDVAAPDDLAAFVPSGGLFTFSVVLVLGWRRGTPQISLHVRRPDIEAARAELAALCRTARTDHNFLRGRTLRARNVDGYLDLDPVRATPVARSEVIHDDAVWAEVDANIGGLARHGATLVTAGLGAGRGMLLAGPPGVGKTALCRVIASELPAGTTIVLVEPGMHSGLLSALYDCIADLAPAAVFLDDLDLLAGNRRHGSGGPVLGEFLTLLDGFRPAVPVVTVATTNVTEALDPALLRPGRFDAIVEIGPPGAPARAQILHRFLDPICSVDVSAVVGLTAGCTGADLREIVRRTVLEHGSGFGTAELVDVARSGRWRPTPPAGQYL